MLTKGTAHVKLFCAIIILWQYEPVDRVSRIILINCRTRQRLITSETIKTLKRFLERINRITNTLLWNLGSAILLERIFVFVSSCSLSRHS